MKCSKNRMIGLMCFIIFSVFLCAFNQPMDSNSNAPQETLQEQKPQSETALPEIITITISAAGDVTLGNTHLQNYSNSFIQTYDKKGSEYFLKNVKDIFAQDDMTIVNFEGVLTTSNELQPKAFNMKGLPEYIDILTSASVEAVSFGNNHRLDYLQKGSDDTVAAFQKANIVYAYDYNVGIYEVKGIRIGFISVNEVYEGAFVENYIQEGMRSLKEQDADLIFVCCHWGIERDNYPTAYQTELGEKCIDWGADLVIGHHPHVLQGIDAYQGKYIIYSLGNFCFGGNRNPSDKDTMIFQQTFTFIDGEKQEDAVARIIPCSISSIKKRNNFQPTPSVGDDWVRIMSRMMQYSSSYEVEFGPAGELSIQNYNLNPN